MTLDELIETYGNTRLSFVSYGDHCFDFFGVASDGKELFFELRLGPESISDVTVSVDRDYKLAAMLDCANPERVIVSVYESRVYVTHISR